MTTKHTAGPDIDLDAEVVRDKKGERFTEGRAEEIAAAALYKAGVARPSLTAPGRRSPEVKARVSAELRDRLHATAQQRGASPSKWVREALDQYLAS